MSENRFKALKTTKKVKFMGQDIDISKLSVSQVLTIQEKAAVVDKATDPKENLKLLSMVIGFGAVELSELSEDDLFELPMDELSNLSQEIMKYSGMGK